MSEISKLPRDVKYDVHFEINVIIKGIERTIVNNVLKKKVVPLIVPAKEKNFFMVSFYKYQN